MVAKCANCGRPGPVELEMTAKNGQTLTMLSCGRCEARTWLADGEEVDLDAVLKISNGDPEFVVRPGTTKPRRATST